MIFRQLANWFHRKKLETSLDRELLYHLDRRTADFERSGLGKAEARRQALLEVGGIAQIQEEVRDIWLTQWLLDFAYDLRFSARSFFKNSSFTISAVLSLMLGIGATTAIYSLVNQVMLHTLPVRDPKRLVLIDWKGDQVANGFGSYNLMSYPICRDLDQQKQFFDGVFCRALTTIDVSTGGDHHPAMAEIVSGNYFTSLGVGATLGRVLTNHDDGTPNANPVVVLSYDFWRTQLGGARDVVGRNVLVNRHRMTVIGGADTKYQGIDVGEVPALWIPASMSAQAIPGFNEPLERRIRWMQVLGRLKDGVSLQQAQVGLQPWFKAMLHEDMRLPGFPLITPERRQRYLNSYLVMTPAPQGHSILRRRLSEPLWMLFIVTAVLLGLACLNVSGLFLARGLARDREIGTRLALGASRGRLGRQLLADSLLIALAGGLLGTAAAPIAVRSLIALLPKGVATTALHAGIDSRLLLFAFVTTVAAGLLSGIAPAWHSGQRSLTASLRERSGTAFGGVRLRKVLVTAQIALTLILVVGAALFVRTLEVLLAKGPGFATSSLVSFGIDSMRGGYSPSEGEKLMARLDEAIRSAPVTEESAVARFPLLTGGSWNNPVTVLADNKQFATDRDINLNSVTPGFFRTLGIRILAGRNFDQRDVRPPGGESGWRSAIVNQAFVRRYLKQRNPLGVRICQGAGPDAKPNIEVVGVMSDFSYRGLREDSEQVYFPFFEGEHSFGAFYVRVRGAPESAFSSLRAAVHTVDPTLPMADFRTVEEQVDRSLNTERMLATLSGSFSTLALLLSVVGLYGVMAFVVAQRTREIGIRLALGAKRWSAIWLILRDALTMILSGIAIGLPFVWALGRLVTSQLYEVKPSDPAVIAISAVLLGFAGVLSATLPANRASRVNPTDALRAE